MNIGLVGGCHYKRTTGFNIWNTCEKCSTVDVSYILLGMEVTQKGFVPLLLVFLHIPLFISIIPAAQAAPKNTTFTAIYVFGDSTMDPGNNDYLDTVFRSNFPPYGKDFFNHTPTGRFSNGRLTTDFLGQC